MFAVIHPKRCTQQSFTCDLLQTSFHCLGSSVTPAINRLSNQNVMQPSPRYVVFGCECSIFSLVLLHCIAPSWAGTPGSELISTMPEALEGVSQTFSDSIDEASEPAPATHFAIQQALQAGSQTAQQLIAVAPAPEELPALLWQQPVIEATAVIDERLELSQAPAPEASPPPEPPPQIFVRTIEVIGSTILDEAQLNPIIQPLEGRNVTLEELRQAADRITQIYLNRGFINSRAVVVDQVVTDGVVQIRVIEGRLERIEIEGTRRVRPEYVRSRIRLGAGVPLNSAALEDQLRLLRADPLFQNIEASLRAGTDIDRSILIVRVSEAKPYNVNFFIDNYSPPSIGSERMGMNFRHRNLFGFGDEMFFFYSRTLTGGANVLDFSYRVPVNAREGAVSLRVAPSWNRITDPDFRELDIRGKQQLYEIAFRQPLIRSPREELALSVGFTHQRGQTFLFNDQPFGFGIGPDEEGNSITSVFRFGQEYVLRDPSGAWALRSQFSLGTGLLDATINPDPIPDSRFVAWLGQVQRVQRLSNDHLLIFLADVQLTPNSLLPSQQFVIGGGQSVRGYRQNARSGDNGFRLSVEDRIAIQRDAAGIPTMQLIPFIEGGGVWNKGDNPNELPRQRFLAAGGLGLLWEPFPRFVVRIDYAVPFITLSDRGENAQDRGLFFSINFQP